MEKYILLDAIMAEIENLLDKGKYHEEFDCAYRDGNNGALYALKNKLNTIEAKEVDLEKDVRQIISLYYEGIKHYEDVIRKEREENGGSDLAIKIMDGIADARELGIQYVIDKLKAQKGEQHDMSEATI